VSRDRSCLFTGHCWTSVFTDWQAQTRARARDGAQQTLAQQCRATAHRAIINTYLLSFPW